MMTKSLQTISITIQLLDIQGEEKLWVRNIQAKISGSQETKFANNVGPE